MNDRSDALAFLKTPPQPAATAGRPVKERPREEEAVEEECCAAFGYLRGLRDRALAIEFRFRDGNSEAFAYSLLASWKFNPSAGLLLKFTGDVVTLVLIRGSNLDALVNQSVNLTDRGLQRHRIEVAEFESQEEMREWLNKAAPAFVRKAR